MAHCNFCLRVFPTGKAVSQHISNTPTCREQLKDMRERSLPCLMPSGSSGDSGEPAAPMDNPIYKPHTYQDNQNFEEAMNIDSNPFDAEHPSSRTNLRAQVEEVEDEYDVWQRFIRSYPGEVATEMGQARTMFEAIRAAQEEKGLDQWGPFKNGKEWELVRWLMRHVGKSGIEEFTDLPMVTSIDGPAGLDIVLIWLISCMVGP